MNDLSLIHVFFGFNGSRANSGVGEASLQKGPNFKPRASADVSPLTKFVWRKRLALLSCGMRSIGAACCPPVPGKESRRYGEPIREGTIREREIKGAGREQRVLPEIVRRGRAKDAASQLKYVGQGRKRSGFTRSGSSHVTSDLSHRLDLRSDMRPVDGAGFRPGHGPGMTTRETQLEAAVRANAELRVQAEMLIAAYVALGPRDRPSSTN